MLQRAVKYEDIDFSEETGSFLCTVAASDTVGSVTATVLHLVSEQSTTPLPGIRPGANLGLGRLGSCLGR